VPLLVMNVASLTGHLHLSPGFEWIGSHYTSIAFGTATLVEVLAYTIPWLDHILDLVATPAAIVAGIIATASMVMDLSPFLKWTLALIAGGGAAAIVQGVTVLLRTKSSALTAGTGNVFVSSLELIGSILTALLAIIVPIVCVALISFLCIFVIWKAGRLFIGRMKIR
jgi:hypothetical protein